MIALARDLCAYRTGVVADENEQLFDRISEEIPLEITRFASGDSHNGWVIPDNWSVESAKIYKDGEEIIDGTSHTQGVGNN